MLVPVPSTHYLKVPKETHFIYNISAVHAFLSLYYLDSCVVPLFLSINGQSKNITTITFKKHTEYMVKGRRNYNTEFETLQLLANYEERVTVCMIKQKVS